MHVDLERATSLGKAYFHGPLGFFLSPHLNGWKVIEVMQKECIIVEDKCSKQNLLLIILPQMAETKVYSQLPKKWKSIFVCLQTPLPVGTYQFDQGPIQYPGMRLQPLVLDILIAKSFILTWTCKGYQAFVNSRSYLFLYGSLNQYKDIGIVCNCIY